MTAPGTVNITSMNSILQAFVEVSTQLFWMKSEEIQPASFYLGPHTHYVLLKESVARVEDAVIGVSLHQPVCIELHSSNVQWSMLVWDAKMKAIRTIVK